MNRCKWASLDETHLKNNEKLLDFFKYLPMADEEKVISEKKKSNNSLKKANDVWKKDSSDYLPVSIHLYSKQEVQLEWADKQHICWVMKPSITFFGLWSRATQIRCRYRVSKYTNEKPNTCWVRSRIVALPLCTSRSICNIWTWVNHLTEKPCKLVFEKINPIWLW